VAAVLSSAAEREPLKFAPAPEGYFFDEFAADRACAFFPRYLTHIKGRFAGRPFELEDWERDIVREIFGWKRPDGTRRYRIVYIEIPRKNGKTTFAAGIGLLLLFADGETSAEVYSCANDKDQASICFIAGKMMAHRSPPLAERSMRHKHFMLFPRMGSAWRVLSSDTGNKDGLNASGVIFDEVHALRDRELADLMHTSTGARTQPLEVYITTAGTDRKSFCYELHERAQRVATGELVDPEFLGVIFAAGDSDDIGDPLTWAKANPSLGRAVSLEYMAAEAKRAKELPRYENVFKRLHLNIWTEQSVRWIPMAMWDACRIQPVALADLAGRDVFGGLDLSSTTDMTALALVAQSLDGRGFDVFLRCWCPEENIKLRSRRDNVPYEQWAKESWLTPTEGNVVDYDKIRAEITGANLPLLDEPRDKPAIIEVVNLRELAIDRWNASQLTTQLTGDGVTVVPFGQGFASMSAPAKELEKLILGGALNHGGNPVLRWAAANVAVETDAAENIKPSKVKSHQRIDPVVALVMALGRAILARKDYGGLYADEATFNEAFPEVAKRIAGMEGGNNEAA
jgi:phage terminase large subunit-like protein